MAITLDKPLAESSNSYFLDHGEGRTEGPLTLEGASEKLRSHGDPNAMIWREGHVWQEAWRYDEFAGLFPQNAPMHEPTMASVIAVNSGRPSSTFSARFSFNGRIRRTEYGLSIIAYYIAVFVIAAATTPMGLMYVLGLVVAFWFLLAQGAKRCHDLGNSGWYQIIPFYVLWMLFGEGDKGANSYGVSPK